MVAKKSASKKTTPKRRRKDPNGFKKLPKLGMVTSVLITHADIIKYAADRTIRGIEEGNLRRVPLYVAEVYNKKGGIKKTAIAAGSGYLAGWAVEEFMPNTGVLGKVKKGVAHIGKKVL